MTRTRIAVSFLLVASMVLFAIVPVAADCSTEVTANSLPGGLVPYESTWGPSADYDVERQPPSVCSGGYINLAVATPRDGLANSVDSENHQCHDVFDGRLNDGYNCWIDNSPFGGPAWVGYRFGAPQVVNRVAFNQGYHTNFKSNEITVQASETGADGTWQDMFSRQLPNSDCFFVEQSFNNTAAFQYWRVYVLNSWTPSRTSGDGNGPGLCELQFFHDQDVANAVAALSGVPDLLASLMERIDLLETNLVDQLDAHFNATFHCQTLGSESSVRRWCALRRAF